MRALLIILSLMAGLSLLAYAPAEAAPRPDAPCHQTMDHPAPQPMQAPAKAPVKAMACCITPALPAPPLLQPRLPGPSPSPQQAILGEQIADGRHPSPEPRPPRV